MPRFSGMDLDQIEILSKTLLTESEKIKQEANAMTTTLEHLPWVGNDQKRFIEEWKTKYLPALLNAATGFETAAGQASMHVRKQRLASRR